MSSVNKAILVGRVGKDPELRTMTSGDRVASFSLATSETWKKDGEKKERTTWHNVVIFNEHLVKLAENYIRKGSLLYVEGAIHTRKYEKDGQDRYVTEIVLQRFRGEIGLLGDNGGGGGQEGEIEERPRATGPKESFDLDSEIPFVRGDGLR